MKEINGWEKVKASDDYDRLAPGGYICNIIGVEDNESKSYLKIEYDIALGEFAGYWNEYAKRSGSWKGEFYRSYKDSAAGMFKGFINAVEASNEGYKWDWREQTLTGKYIGLVIGDEEYIANDGSLKTWPKVRTVKSVQDIKEGRFRVPETKKVETEEPVVPDTPLNTDDFPF